MSMQSDRNLWNCDKQFKHQTGWTFNVSRVYELVRGTLPPGRILPPLLWTILGQHHHLYHIQITKVSILFACHALLITEHIHNTSRKTPDTGDTDNISFMLLNAFIPNLTLAACWQYSNLHIYIIPPRKWEQAVFCLKHITSCVYSCNLTSDHGDPASTEIDIKVLPSLLPTWNLI